MLGLGVLLLLVSLHQLHVDRSPASLFGWSASSHDNTKGCIRSGQPPSFVGSCYSSNSCAFSSPVEFPVLELVGPKDCIKEAGHSPNVPSCLHCLAHKQLPFPSAGCFWGFLETWRGSIGLGLFHVNLIFLPDLFSCVAMGQNPNRTPSEHPNPHYRQKWVVHLPQNDTIGFGNHSRVSPISVFASVLLVNPPGFSLDSATRVATPQVVELHCQGGNTGLRFKAASAVAGGETPHHLEAMGNHCWLVFAGESSFRGLLGGAGFRPSTVSNS